MARSFVRQGVNIICSNMTISTPRKLGLNPAKEPVETAGITIYSKFLYHCSIYQIKSWMLVLNVKCR